jgi:hypothetical protein
LGPGGIGGFVGSESPGSGFNPLVKIGIGIKRAAAGKVWPTCLFWPTCLVWPTRLVRSTSETAEVIDDAVLFEKQQERRQAALGDHAAARGPKTIAYVDGLDRDGMLAGVGRLIEENDALLVPCGQSAFLRLDEQAHDQRASGEAAMSG